MCRQIDSLSEICEHFSALVVDVWGVLCDGFRAYEPATEALADFRNKGPVILLSNTARSETGLAQFLSDMNIGPSCYDRIVTAGQTCLSYMQADALVDSPVFHMGCPKDLHLFAENAGLTLAQEVQNAAAILCTGPIDEEGDLSAERALLHRARTTGIEFLCANPDLQVRVGSRIVPCAGRIAAEYEAMGGTVRYFGKPHEAVYDYCKALLGDAGVNDGPEKVLAIGDTLATDIAGAHGAGFSSLFISNGETGLFSIGSVSPMYYMTRLA
ncbi:TIGR01459 family HAD-type hydrolase [uncultured Roseibium sp.]|uniref:TIGR01459 family HAD-type hydrolase n=1 Tax=uncultured Roseibium sp. TaxID=1936171 RepID=UPI0026191464|nr:TIGR01459 family HAD-type hydrolase [uncultured Roseibium sp.]